jgi:phytoene synthase
VDDLDTLVRRVDEDRWLATRFAPSDVRARLIALYAVNYEIARIAETARERALGEIKLQWWREAIDELFDGGPPRAHPALVALKRVIGEAPLQRDHFHRMIDARRLDFETAPFKTGAEYAFYIHDTAGALMRLAIEACGVVLEGGPIEGFVTSAGYRWGATGLLRAEPIWRARGRDLTRPGVWTYSDLEVMKFGGGARRMRWRLSRQLPVNVFPAVGYVALVPAYLGSMHVRQSAPLFERQLRLVIASATGLF